MVAAVRRNVPQREVARRFGVSLCTVQRWVQRAEGQRLDRVDWSNLSHAPRRTYRTSPAIEQKVLQMRRWLREHSALGEYEAPAIWRELQQRGQRPCPSIPTISRILRRHGVQDVRRRVRRPPPPRGWYLADVAAGKAELDSFDTIEGLAILGGPDLTILTGISLHGGMASAWAAKSVGAKTVVAALIEHWQAVGLPAFVQFDNDNRFQGPKQHADVVGRVSRLCLSLGVTPVFAPPNETGFQAAIESFNNSWQAKVWRRFRHRSLRGLQSRSARYLAAHRQRHARRIESAPRRRRFPKRWQLDLQQHPHGKIFFLRRTNDHGKINLMGHAFLVDRSWIHRLVRAEVNLDANHIRFYALRRRDPTSQPLLGEVQYSLPKKPFKE
jgi:putative transposase